MKKHVKYSLIALCLLVMVFVVIFASCVENEQPTEQITITVKLNLEGQDDKSFTVDKNVEFFSKLAEYVPQDIAGCVLSGWTDEDGNPVTADTRWDKDGTVTAVWTDTFAITFNKNNPAATGEMAVMTAPCNATSKLTANAFQSSYEFGGWNTRADGLGEFYPDEHYLYVTGDLTLYAQWKVNYSEEIWVEKFDGSEYIYVKEKYGTRDGYLGNNVSIQMQYDQPHYVLNETHPDAETDAPSLKDGAVLKAYYALERVTIKYMPDGESKAVRYGEQYTITTPDQDENAKQQIVWYSASSDGSGTKYAFGQTITAEQNLTLYAVTAEIFTDADGSADKAMLRNTVGLGSAALIKDGKTYEGFAVVNGESVTFEVNVRENDQDNGVTYFGKFLDNGTFLYRNEDEVGTYVLYDYLSDDLYMSIMLALDGYGMGVLAFPANDGTERLVNYMAFYEATDDGDYYMVYYLPAEPDYIYEGFFQIVREPSEDYPQLAGYFMLNGEEYGDYYLLYNWQLQEQGLFLDGYGEAILYGFDENGEIDEESFVKGMYWASDEYTDAAPEYVFYSYDQQTAFLFVVIRMEVDNGYVYLFTMQGDECGVYTQEQNVEFPELYLDGYGGALYTSDEDVDGRLGYYTIEIDDAGNYLLLIEFDDEAGGKMRVTLDIENNLFINNTVGDFVIINGVLTEYLGESSIIVIPEGVTEIADGVFKDVNITTLTLPSTIEKIGVYAFQNSASATEHSLLTTIYINATTPPVLASDPNAEGAPNPFRWLQDNAKIIVPDDCENAYIEAESWSRYGKYITTRAIIANKPLFEIDENGVLLSYNNKDENPENVTIEIPDEVTEIADGVFASLEYIVSVNLNNVTVIGSKAFYGCINLTTVTFNANTVSIGDSAFYQCSSLTELDLGNVRTIGASAFNRCFKLSKVVIGSQITSIGDFAFAMCSVDVSDDESMIVPSDLVIAMSAATAPTMGNYVFKQSQPRIYVDSFEMGVNYAKNAKTTNWVTYVTALRVKREGEAITYYSKTNMGAPLVLADRADFDNGSYLGLYKTEGDYIYITWISYSALDNVLTVDEQSASADSNGEIKGFILDDEQYVFVSAGKQITFTHTKGDETLSLTYGESQASFNGDSVTIEIVNYRMQFTVDGYVYKLTLYSSNEFSYTKTRLSYVKSYTAADGSAITVTFYENGYSTLHKVVGTLKSDTLKYADGRDCYTETGWYILVKEGSDVTAWDVKIYNDTYTVTAVFNDEDNTFTYTVTKKEA